MHFSFIPGSWFFYRKSDPSKNYLSKTELNKFQLFAFTQCFRQLVKFVK